MIIKKSDFTKKIAEGSINELVDVDLALIGSNDEVSSPTDVTSNSTSDSHFAAVTQQNGKDRTNSQLGALDIANTLMEEEEVDDTPETQEVGFTIPDLSFIKERYPIVARNLEVLIDSIKRRDIDPIADGIILSELIEAIQVAHVPSSILKALKVKLEHPNG